MNQGPPRIFDRRALSLHRERASRFSDNGPLIQEATTGIADRLSAINRQFIDGYVIDTLDTAMQILEANARYWSYATLGATEGLPLHDMSFDLVLSVLSLHAVNDLPGVLAQARRLLRPDGLFIAALFGGETLTELRQSLSAAELAINHGVSPRVAPFGDVRDLGGLLQRAGFALPVADIERTVIRYGAFSTLVNDLRAMGETNALFERSRKPMSRVMLAATAESYARHFADPDGKLRATFDIVYLTGWAPHESQQKPLKPASATVRLADALGTTEVPTGEKPGQ
ncbi:MAG TPA: methyltransferase domain-containing protein [Rhizomicrobium sp.]|nr:methyltransferase domain-containing protein [Rhizomicrobium sp.]